MKRLIKMNFFGTEMGVAASVAGSAGAKSHCCKPMAHGSVPGEWVSDLLRLTSPSYHLTRHMPQKRRRASLSFVSFMSWPIMQREGVRERRREFRSGS